MSDVTGDWLPLEAWQRAIVDRAPGEHVRFPTAAEERRGARLYADSLGLAFLVVDGYELELKRDSIVATRGDECTLYISRSPASAEQMFELVGVRLDELRRALAPARRRPRRNLPAWEFRREP